MCHRDMLYLGAIGRIDGVHAYGYRSEESIVISDIFSTYNVDDAVHNGWGFRLAVGREVPQQLSASCSSLSLGYKRLYVVRCSETASYLTLRCCWIFHESKK